MAACAFGKVRAARDVQLVGLVGYYVCMVRRLVEWWKEAEKECKGREGLTNKICLPAFGAAHSTQPENAVSSVHQKRENINNI